MACVSVSEEIAYTKGQLNCIYSYKLLRKFFLVVQQQNQEKRWWRNEGKRNYVHYI